MQGLTIYKSSAGSGKTYTLVKEYLRIVLANPWDYKHILAVTFTNKATGEMKSRIIGTLSRLEITPYSELGPDQQLYDELQAELKARGLSCSVADQAGKVLRLILNDYSNFSVSTIESFFQRIVRAFARELGIPLGYDVEMQQEVVLQRVVDEMFLEVGENEKLTQLFTGFLKRQMEEEKGWKLDNEVKALGREIFKEKFQRLAVNHSDAEDRITVILEVVKELQAIRKGFESQLVKLAEEGVQILGDYGMTPDDFKQKGRGPGNYFNQVLKGKYEPNSYVRKAYKDQLGWYNPKSADAFRVEQVFEAGLDVLLDRALDHYDAQGPAYQTAIQVLRTLHSFGVLNDLRIKLDAYRRERNQLIISDTNFLLHPFVKDKDAPFIYEKVGSRYQYYLLDEFQDTSDMQWQNLRPLLGDALGNGTGGMIVGDAKQSIYRWRNGNMDLILREVSRQVYNSFGQEVVEEELRQNWRSSKDIVAFNNALFDSAKVCMAANFSPEHAARFTAAYQDVGQEVQKQDLPGLVSVEFFPDRSWRDPEEVPRWKDLALTRTSELIHQLKAEGFQGNQIMLLVRKNGEGVEIAEYLQQQAIKVVSNESLLIANHPWVLFLQAVLEHLNHEYDAVSRASLVYYHHLLAGNEAADHDLFKSSLEEVFSAAFEPKKQQLRQLPVYECVEQLIRLFPQLLAPNAYVQGFLDTVLEYSSSQDASISGFLEWWEEMKSRRPIASAPEVDAVQIMTIHKSKGLEFPVVIVPYADWEMTPGSRDVLWLSSDQAPFSKLDFLPVKLGKALEQTYFSAAYEEEKLMSALDNLNLLYVAFTRPEFRLYAFTKDLPKANPATINNLATLLNLIIPPETLPGRMLESPRRFECGTAIPPKEESGKQADAETVPLVAQSVSESDWDKRMRIRFTFDRYPHVDMMAQREKVDIGEILHDALSFVKTGVDIPYAVDRMVLKGYTTEAERSTLHHQLTKVLEGAVEYGWYSGEWEVRNEADIIGENGTLLRPDRVMVKEGKAVVVDYKTGRFHNNHQDQVRIYCESLQKIGYEQVSGFVYYIGSTQIQPIESLS